MSGNVWFVALPNEGNKSSEATYKEIKVDTASSKHNLAECFQIEYPSDLLVGTLDTLMSLSDDLVRVDATVEGVVRKIERQFHELQEGDQALTVDGVPVERYLNYFAWDDAKHPHRRPLPEIVQSIQSSTGKTEEELKQLSSRYAEKKQQLQLQQRKQGGSLMVANLAEVLTPEVVSPSDFINTEYLQTLVVVVPKSLEETWLNEYMTIGEDIVEYGAQGSQGNSRGSPVVPNSTKKIYAEGDSVLYTVTILKGHYQAGSVGPDGNFEQGSEVSYVEEFKTRAREKKFIARDFTFDPEAHASSVEAMAELEVEVERLWSGLIRWCKAHFGEAFIAWMHIKVIRVFVESVLRYGLPVNFAMLMFRPLSGKDKKLRSVLEKKYAHLQPSQFAEGEDDSAAAAGQGEYYPYVSTSFHPLSS